MRKGILAETYTGWQERPDPWRQDDRRLTIGDAARALRVTTEGVRDLVRRKRLDCERTRSGMRLFRPDDVLRLVDARAQTAVGNARPERGPARGVKRQLRLRLFARVGRKAT